MTPSSEQFDPFDPFDLPDWLGTADVVWAAEGELRGAPRVHGILRPAPAASGSGGSLHQTLDLLAVDAAYPRTLCPNKRRHDAHQAWHFGEVLLMQVDGRVVAAVPTTVFDPNLACLTIARVARAIGADPNRFTVNLTL